MDNVDLREPEQTEDAEAVPFLARFQEDQKRVRTGVKAGAISATKKYPSDRDEDVVPPVTLKYPTDGEDL
ncbi:microviridin/marinostatin family tricyclic proteinase inhibitor [Sorangium sp. So ce1335]|uniref:microviridin/marinostatin family tricyclic proteinase inhibitor n=1 Tax=Sorangium sp. So ce1335 TaxID=3133335 RepID=UPI003F646800